MSNYRYWLLFIVTAFVGMFAYFVGHHSSSLERIEYQITMNTLALDHCSNALTALVMSKSAPINCLMAETHWESLPQYTNNFIHAVRFAR